MARLVRPYIPLKIRVQVAALQAGFKDLDLFLRLHKGRLTIVLDRLLFGDELGLGAGFTRGQIVNLDHDPPIGARKKVYRNGVHVDYSPKANDPRYLVYRTKTEHQLKTNVRGEHGQHPDRVLIKKNRRLERGTKRRKAKIRSANRWPPRGSRKIQNRK